MHMNRSIWMRGSKSGEGPPLQLGASTKKKRRNKSGSCIPVDTNNIISYNIEFVSIVNGRRRHHFTSQLSIAATENGIKKTNGLSYCLEFYCCLSTTCIWGIHTYTLLFSLILEHSSSKNHWVCSEHHLSLVIPIVSDEPRHFMWKSIIWYVIIFTFLCRRIR